MSRGLLHYYFATKERLLAEVVRRDCELRMAALDDQLAPARNADDVIDALVASLKRYVEEEPEFITVVFELFTLSRRNEEIASEFAELLRRTREHVAELLARKQAEGALHLRAEPEAVADVLFSLADGLCLRMLTETDHDFARRSTRACSPSARCSTERAPRSIGAWISVPSSSPSRTPTAPTPTRPASR